MVDNRLGTIFFDISEQEGDDLYHWAMWLLILLLLGINKRESPLNSS